MDIRDVKNPEIGQFPNNFLKGMFELQQELLDQYTAIEKMPAYPLKLDLKPSQTIIKDFAARVVEELGEGYESYEKMYGMIQAHAKHYNISTGINKIDLIDLPQDFSNNLYNFSEELSDALHFYLELFLLLGIGYSDFSKLCYKLPFIEDARDDTGIRVDDLRSISHDLQERTLPLISTVNLVTVVIMTTDTFLRCGTIYKIGETNHNLVHMFWAVTYNLQLVRNELKNKPWKQTGVLTDTSRFNELLITGFIHLFGIFDSFGMQMEDIYTLYYKKNVVNQFRIKSKY